MSCLRRLASSSALALLAGCATACASADAEPGQVADAALGSDAAGAGDAASGSDGAGADVGQDTNPAEDATTGDTAAPTTYGVGVLQLETAGAAGRTLPTMVWYPTAPDAEGAPAKYFLDFVPSPHDARIEAPPAEGPFPLVAFSHGNQGIRDQSFFLAEALARHGYVVASADHVGNTLTDFDANLTGAMTLWRPQDLKAVISRLLTPQKGDPAWLQGLVDAEHVAVAGHSFGGYTALAVAGARLAPPPAALPDCASPTAATQATCEAMAELGPPPWDFHDPRVDLAIPLAHALTAGFEKKSIQQMPVPVMLQAALGDTTTPVKAEAKAAYDLIGGPKSLMILQGGSHFSFANMCDALPLAPAAVKKSFEALCAADAQPTIGTSHEAIVFYALAACDLYLRGDEAMRAVFSPGLPADLPVEVFSEKVLEP